MYREALEQKPLAEMAEQVRAQPDFTPLDELPRLYRDAVVAVEDHRFYSHGGVDFIALCRALWNLSLIHISQAVAAGAGGIHGAEGNAGHAGAGKL